MVDRIHDDGRKYIHIRQSEELFCNEEVMAELRLEGVSHGRIWKQNSRRKEQV